MNHYNRYQIDRAQSSMRLGLAGTSADLAACAFRTIEEQYTDKADQMECEMEDLRYELAEAHSTIRQHEGRIDELEEAIDQAVSQLVNG